MSFDRGWRETGLSFDRGWRDTGLSFDRGWRDTGLPLTKRLGLEAGARPESGRGELCKT